MSSLNHDEGVEAVKKQSTSITEIFDWDLQYHVVIFIVSLFVIVILIKFQKSNGKRMKRNKIQSIPLLPMIGYMLQIAWNKQNIGKLSERWAKVYGPILKVNFFGRHFVLVSCPSTLQKLLSSHNPGHLEKPQDVYLKVFVGTSGKGLLASKYEEWAPHRKVLSKAFNYEALKSYVTVFRSHGNRLVSTLDKIVSKSTTTSNINSETLGPLLHNFCLEVIIEIVLGISVDDALTKEEHTRLPTDIQRIKELVTARFSQPWLLLEFVWKFHPYKKELETRLKSSQNLFNKVMNEQMKKPLNISNQSICMLDEMTKANWSQEEVISEVAALLLGGHETIALALLFLFFLLATEPEHQRACQEEVDTLYEDLERSGKELSIESLSQLKYLERCIKETLRMFPPSPTQWRQLRAPLQLDDDNTIDSGTTIVCSTWALHRGPECFPNPGKFDPHRFLPENCRSRPSHSYNPFSSGDRNCIGWKMGMLEVTSIAAIVLRHFDLSTSDKLEDIKINFSFTIWPSKEPKVLLQRRVF